MYTLDTDLRQLENVFLPVDDFERAIGEPSSNIPGVEPAIFVNGLSRLVRILQVALKHVRAKYTHLQEYRYMHVYTYECMK